MSIYTANEDGMIQEFLENEPDLSADGFAIHKNILSSNECENLQEMLYQYLSEISSNQPKPFHFNQPRTYKVIYDYFPTRKLLLQNFSFGHNPLSWYVRCHEKVQEQFAQIYGIQQNTLSDNGKNKLVTSFDGVSIIPPCEQTIMGWHEGVSKLHCDQSFSISEFRCVQGQVPIFDVRKGDATLRVLRGSHLLHSDFAEAFHLTNVPNEWTALTDEQIQWYRDRLDQDADVYVSCPKGSLVLWDSRTIHDGTKPQKWRSEPNWRCTLFVCMQPRINDPIIAKKRENAFLLRRNTTHDPNKVKLFPINPRTYNKPFIPPKSIKLEDYGLSLQKIQSLV
uniref:Phytanoyl-CoA dioxygenase n=1 Tax=Panagrolaimus superbus TaxID=310955 RepID=A0A914Z848_9BILA